jgi:RNA polymerase sigma-70 factor (ECF subfamily)
MLTVLETLGPSERAVFVLHEVFDVAYDEIAEAVGKSSATVRQIAHRARQHVAARRPRMEVSRPEQQRVVERFLAALATGDVQGLMDVLAPDVVMVSDGGGLVPTVRHPVEGRERAAALLSRFSQVVPDAVVATLLLNGSVAARIQLDPQRSMVITFVVEDGRITRLYGILNPHKLRRLEKVAELRR